MAGSHRRIAATSRHPALVWLPFVAVAVTFVPAIAAGQTWGGAVGISSDNVYRGVSLTAGHPAWLLDLHRPLGARWVVGLSASTERPWRQSSGAELVVYAQRGWRLDDDWSVAFSFKHHESPWNRYRDQRRYDEASLNLAWRGRFSLSVSVSPNSAGYYPRGDSERDAALWLEAGYRQPLIGRLSANVGIGHAQFGYDELRDYSYASAGLRYGIGNVYLYLSWLSNSLDRRYYQRIGLADPRWTASAVWSFP